MTPGEHVTVFLFRLIETACAVIVWNEVASFRVDSDRCAMATAVRVIAGYEAYDIEGRSCS